MSVEHLTGNEGYHVLNIYVCGGWGFVATQAEGGWAQQWVGGLVEIEFQSSALAFYHSLTVQLAKK